MIDKPVLELLAPNMVVAYSEEMGSDAGGLTRDWFHAVATELANGADDLQGTSLFATAPDGTLIPRPVQPQDDQDKFRLLLAAGRFLALAVYREQPLPISFGLITCKHILGVPVGMDDVRQLDPEFYRGRVEAVLRRGGLASLNAVLDDPLTFMSAASPVHPIPEPLKEGGESIQVSDENKTEYVQLLCEAYLCSGIRREIQSLLQGFYALLPYPTLRHCGVTPRELSILITGIAVLDAHDWRINSYGGDTQVHMWFWELVQDLDAEQRCMLLHFATGSSRLPPGGFRSLKPPFTVSVNSGSSDRLPVAHTCANQLVLQEYDSKAQLEEKLLLALSTESFELV
jgi:E3 ubiquitin-protein ligase HUWE1